MFTFLIQFYDSNASVCVWPDENDRHLKLLAYDKPVLIRIVTNCFSQRRKEIEKKVNSFKLTFRNNFFSVIISNKKSFISVFQV